jgi:hypothetical protein
MVLCTVSLGVGPCKRSGSPIRTGGSENSAEYDDQPWNDVKHL